MSEGKIMRKHLIVAASLTAVALVGPATAGAHHHRHHDSLAAARAETAKYQRLDNAISDGYGKLLDANRIACIDNPGVGGMGVHYVSDALVGDGKVNATTPEALVYEPRGHGRLRLVALEYVVFQSDWDKAHRSPPRLFGQQFELMPADNRYGLPPFYELHAWVWKHNPRGLFDDWNPRVNCAPKRTSWSKAHGRKTHTYKSAISSATLSTGNGYPGPDGTAVLAGSMRLTGFGEGALVDRLKITGQPKPNVFSFVGREVDYLASGSWRSNYTGTDTIQPDGSQKITVDGRFTNGTGKYRGAKGTYHFAGTVPPGSTVLTGHSNGSITY
jgi:hypothetical protein